MADAVEVQINVRRDAGGWTVDVTCEIPGDEALMYDAQSGLGTDLAELREYPYDDPEYGRRLTAGLFGDGKVLQTFNAARTIAEQRGMPVRARLFISPDAPELQDLRWETLRDPRTDGPLLSSEHVLFSRFLSSKDARTVKLRSKRTPRAVVAVSNPNDVSSLSPSGVALAPVHVGEELGRVRTALVNAEMVVLASGPDADAGGTPAGRPTLEALVAQVREGCDILYLVCHGFVTDNQPQLLLEDNGGNVSRVPGISLVERLYDVVTPPRLVVLASCQSAGPESWSRDQGALSALGPRLAAAGVPAVLAMQGDVSMETIGKFMPVFFGELHKHGEADRAMAVARGVVRDRPDWWVPVLFMRLKTGRVWYEPGFGEGFDKWESLKSSVRSGRCTPVLGPGLTDALLGSRLDLANDLIKNSQVPLEPHERTDLVQVAQYLVVAQDRNTLRDKQETYVRDRIVRLFGDRLPEELHTGPIDKLVSEAGNLLQEDPNEPHRVLAAKKFAMYVTTEPADLMASALRREGKQPRVEVCRWYDPSRLASLDAGAHGDERADAEHPLVFHLFGHFAEPDSLVLTEDDYFDHLIGVKSNLDVIPSQLRTQLVDSSLLFIGFSMREWDFRVLFRSIMTQGGSSRRRQYTHVGVQLDPEDDRSVEPARARAYLARYFGQAEVTIYWGGVDDFVDLLRDL